MKTKLFLLLTFISIKVFAQTPINTLQIENGTVYSVLNYITPLNETATGANALWNFNQLSVVGQDLIVNSTPTSTELSTYPGSTNVLNSTSTINSSVSLTKLYTKTVGNSFSITGLHNDQLDLNYAINNATIGVLPMNYNYSNTDTTSGTYTFGANSGTFSGNVTSTVDGYGSLSLSGIGFTSANVTRLKTVQNINLNFQIFSGTVVQTTYDYFNQTLGMNAPVFRSSVTIVSIPALGVNQTNRQYEVISSLLNTTSHTNNIFVSFYPNPVKNILNIKNESNAIINSILITENNGRVVLNTNTFENGIDLSNMQAGIYFVNVITDYGNCIRKIIKN